MALTVPYPTDQLIARKTGYGFARDLWSPNSFDYDKFEDKFFGDALWGGYPTAKTNGTSAAVTFAEHNENAYLSFISGTADNGYAGQGLGLNFTGDRGVLGEFLIVTPAAVTTMKIEVGFSDADDDAGAVNIKATPSSTASDYAVLCFDTDDDTNWSFISAKAGTEVATQDIETVAASSTYRLAVRIVGDSCEAYVNGSHVAGHADGIEGGSKITPWVFVQARAGSASRTILLHKWRCLQPAY
tara:strand:- start:653 stop:1381 length:729 start_codon:yes stop_codon:yes gene_type:complete